MVGKLGLGPARWPWRCAPGQARPRSARGRARRRSLAVLEHGLVPGRGGGVTRAPVGGRCRRRVGGHLRRNGRVCRSSARTAPAPHHHASGLQVAAGRLAPDPGRPLDAPQRPAEASQGEDLLSFLFSQDVAHAGQEHAVPDRRQRLGALSGMAGFQVSTNGRFWVSTEASTPACCRRGDRPHRPRTRRCYRPPATAAGCRPRSTTRPGRQEGREDADRVESVSSTRPYPGGPFSGGHKVPFQVAISRSSDRSLRSGCRSSLRSPAFGAAIEGSTHGRFRHRTRLRNLDLQSGSGRSGPIAPAN